MTRRRKERAKEPPKSNSGWRTFATAFIVALIGLVGVVLAAGPDTVVEHTKAAFGSYPAPEILRVQEARSKAGYVVTIANPSHEEVTLLGYRVEPVVAFAAASEPTNHGGGVVSRVVAEDASGRCKAGKRDVSLARTVAVNPKKTMELEIHPWTLNQSCSFELRFQTSHGDSTTITVPEFDLDKLVKEQKNRLPVLPRTKICPDGAVLLAKDPCEALRGNAHRNKAGQSGSVLPH